MSLDTGASCDLVPGFKLWVPGSSGLAQGRMDLCSLDPQGFWGPELSGLFSCLNGGEAALAIVWEIVP